MTENTEASTAGFSRRFPLYIPVMVITNIIWGAAFPITKPGLADFPPATFAFLRFVLAALVLVPLVVMWRGGWHFDWRTWKLVAVGGVMGFSLVQLGQNWGLMLSSASDIAIIAATQPLTMALLAALFLRERPDVLTWLGFFVSLGGVCFVIGLNPFEMFSGASSSADTGSANSRMLGDIIFFVGTFGCAVYNIINRRLVQRHDTLELTAGAVIWGMLGLAPFSGWEVISGGSNLHFSEWVIIGLVYSALGVTVFGFLALAWSLRQATATKIAVLYYLQPLSGVLLAWLSGEKLGWTFGIGSLLIIVGVYLAERWGKITA